MFEFLRFRLDPEREQLWQGERSVPLRPKTWLVLRLLVERSGELVRTSELLDTVWSDVDVTQGTLTQSIAELRRVLGDDTSQPRFIQTVHRRGYRFIAKVRSSPSPEAPQRPSVAILPSPSLSVRGKPPDLVGREAELERLDHLLQQAQAGHRQIAFVTGEAGIGKSSLIRAFLERIANGKTAEKPVWIVGAKCVEFVGEGETYLPVLEAFEQLARIAGTELVNGILQRRAPTWLAQMPWVSNPRLSRVMGVTPKRMLREFCVALEALTAERTLVLWFEDLHWGDSGTIDLLAALASRPGRCRVCVLATYRPVEAAVCDHPVAPLKRTLLQQEAGIELPLGLLGKAEVQSYLDHQLPPGAQPSVVDWIYQQTEGNPLFMVTLVDHLVTHELLGQTDVGSPWAPSVPLEDLRASGPESLCELIEMQLTHMDAETLSSLEAASVEGLTFSAQAVAAATGDSVESVEEKLRSLAGRGLFLDALGAERWPDGSLGEQFLFRHSAFCHNLYRRQTAAGRQGMHLRIAKRFEKAYENEAGPVVAEMAMHFEKGGDPERAVHYLAVAAAGVRQRAGDRAAMAYFERALELVAQLPGSDGGARAELSLRIHLWKELNASTAFPMSGQERSLERALVLCDQLADAETRIHVSSCLTRCLIIQSKLDAAGALIGQETETNGLGDPILRAVIHCQTGDIAFYRAQFERALREQALCVSALEDVDPSETRRVLGRDLAVMTVAHQGWAEWLQGRPDKARRSVVACVERAQASGYPCELALALGRALLVEQFRRDVDAADRLASSLAGVVEEYGFDFPYSEYWSAMGWVESRTGDLEPAIARLREGLSVARHAQTLEFTSHLLGTIAQLQLEMGASREGLATIDEALAFVEATGERFWEAEIHRLKGALLLLEGGDGGAEACLRRALEVAHSQGARSLELRAATSLSQLWSDESRKDEARSLLASVYGGFTEGFDTQDLRDAKALLDSL